MKKRGRKSAAELATEHIENYQAQKNIPKAPKALGVEGRSLWKEILHSRTEGFYGPGDLPLLEQFCYLTKALLPDIEDLIGRDLSPKHVDMLCKVITRSESLAKDLRLCVSSRTRPDSKKMDDSMPGKPPWVE